MRRSDPNYMKEYYEANKEKILAQKKLYYEANKEKCNARCKAWCKANREKKNAYNKAYRDANKEKERERGKLYYQNNKGYYATKADIRRGRIKAINEIIDEDDKWVLQEMYELAKLRAEVTEFAWDVDHIIPLSKGGKHALDNLQVVSRSWNRRKHNRHSEKYFGATKEIRDGRNH